ncbi:MAG: hypothetical protein K2X53_03520 [Alphaproteobacteria bacterium]|nr:hypothetical protein [Alphaproteobacteria bacterium]
MRSVGLALIDTLGQFSSKGPNRITKDVISCVEFLSKNAVSSLYCAIIGGLARWSYNEGNLKRSKGLLEFSHKFRASIHLD